MFDRDALLRIDATGAMHPVGRLASQHMRPRMGEWRLVPSPKELVIARTAAGSDAVLRLAGEIRSPGALSDIVALAGQSAWRGELVVLADAGTRTFYFDAGSVVGAQTTVPDERLGETLYRFGVITREQLDAIVKVTTETGKRLGEAAVELGMVAAETLFSMMERQVEEVFFAAVQISEGAFYFFDRFDERLLLRRHAIHASGLLMEAARRMERDAVLPGEGAGRRLHSDAAPRQAPARRPRRHVRDVRRQAQHHRIARATTQLEFDVTRAIFQLVSAGAVHVVAPRPRGPEAIQETYNRALAMVHERCDKEGKGVEMRDGLARFATGGSIYNPLFMGAGPQADGTLKPTRIAHTVEAMAGEDPDAWLIGLMNDYVGFALFQAESLLAREAHAKLLTRRDGASRACRLELEHPYVPGTEHVPGGTMSNIISQHETEPTHATLGLEDDDAGVPRSKRKKLRKEGIIAEATKLFAERGYEGASVGDLAERVGLRKASLFHHFPSKDVLYATVLGQLLESVREAVQHALDARSSSRGAARCAERRAHEHSRRATARGAPPGARGDGLGAGHEGRARPSDERGAPGGRHLRARGPARGGVRPRRRRHALRREPHGPVVHGVRPRGGRGAPLWHEPVFARVRRGPQARGDRADAADSARSAERVRPSPERAAASLALAKGRRSRDGLARPDRLETDRELVRECGLDGHRRVPRSRSVGPLAWWPEESARSPPRALRPPRGHAPSGPPGSRARSRAPRPPSLRVR